MPEFLLLVPEVLAAEQFDGWFVQAHRNGWPMISDLPRPFKASEYSHVAATATTDADSVRQMLKTLATMEAADRRIVFAENALPADLRGVFPQAMQTLVQRVVPQDLMCISANVIQTSATSDSIPAAILSGNSSAACLQIAPNCDRLPLASPGSSNDLGISSATLIAALDNALTEIKVPGAERKCLTSGILLRWDFLDESHEISQSMEGRGNPRTADYWHGIMHRREPDAGNAAYWFRRVGKHPAFDSLSKNLDRWMQELGASEEELMLAGRKVLANGSYDPFAVIELSPLALRKPGQVEDNTLRRIQYLEIVNLLAWSMGTTS
jgi:hypothetical protein